MDTGKRLTGRFIGVGESLAFFLRGVLVDEPISLVQKNYTFVRNKQKM